MKKPILIVFLLSLFFSESLISQKKDCNDKINTGEGTYYSSIAGTDSGNCSLPIAANDFDYCAMNKLDYDWSAPCGACIEAQGPIGKIVVKVVDSCPECKEGDVDFSEKAFSKIAKVIDGRVPISWKYVACPQSLSNGSIKIRHKMGSHQYWSAFQFQNIKHAISKVEYKKNNSWKEVERMQYNYFVEPSGIAAPMILRVTSIMGEKLEFKNVPFSLTKLHDTKKQFSTPEACMQQPAVAGKIITIKKKMTDYYINVNNGEKNYQDVYLDNRANNNNQEWEEINHEGGFYSYIKEGTTYALDGGGTNQSGNPVYLFEYDANNYNQHWKKITIQDGSFLLEKRNAPNLAIDGGKGAEKFRNLQLYTKNINNLNQHWNFSEQNKTLAMVDVKKVKSITTTYPNPVMDVLTITNLPKSAYKIIVYSCNSQAIKEIKIEKQQANMTVNVNELSEGLYFLEIWSSNQKELQKFIKK